MTHRFAPLFAACLLVGGLQAQSKSDLSVAKIMADSKWIGVSPSRINWSEDGQSIYFRWNPDAEDDNAQYRYDVAAAEIVKVSDADERWLPPSGGDYSDDRLWKTYTQYGDVQLLNIGNGEVSHITTTQARESAARFYGNDIVYRQGDNLYLWQRESGQTRQIIDFRKGEAPADKKPEGFKGWLAREERSLIGILDERLDRQARQKEESKNDPPDIPAVYYGKSRVRNVQLSPDRRFVTFLKVDEPKDRAGTMVPNYITESGFAEEIKTRPNVGSPGTQFKFGIFDIAGDKVTYLNLDEVPGIDAYQAFTGAKRAEKKSDRRKGKAAENREVFFQGPLWSDDGKTAVLQLLAQDFKDRWLMRLDLQSGRLTVLLHEHDDAWLGSVAAGFRRGAGTCGWLQDNSTIWYQSERTGYAHLYTVNRDGKKRKQLTKGKFEVYNPVLTPDGASFIFTANVDHPGIRHAYRLPVGGGDMQQITHLPGRVDVSLSPDGSQLALRHSVSNRPWELYLQAASSGAEAQRITHSQSDAFKDYPWREPEFVVIPARDKANIYGRLYKPDPANANGAGVVFVHGAGYLHNAHQWWSTYFREYMFNNMLTDMGYTVLDLDYRASAGYGRDWRTAIYRHMGGKDLDDNVDGAAYLVKKHGVDPQRIGMYGGSYGGFIALMAMFTEPGVFAAAAGLRSVTDWAHYNHGYTSRILNIPVADSVAYRRSSPIYHAEGLEGALLMLHGMVDTNVHFQDVVRLSQRLIELGKDNWELAVYPMEGHAFKEPSSWTDEYSRILKLFEDNLR